MSSIAESSTDEGGRWLSIAEAARRVGVSEMTLYRTIAAGKFPAVRIGTRLCVPVRAIDELARRAISTGRLVDAAEWVGVSG